MGARRPRLHWFNPENDLTLARGCERYTPPRQVVWMRQAGAAMPLWYAAPADAVLAADADSRWYEAVARDFPLPSLVVDAVAPQAMVPCPWGWSAYARRCFLTWGADAADMPTPAQVDVMRRLSHRRTAAEICRRLRDMCSGVALAEPAIEATTMDEVRRRLATSPAMVLKAPWSSSGRGVVDARTTAADKVLRQANDAIYHQGSVMMERAYDKVMDFARIFECRNGRCFDLGTSVFTTDARGAYTGNLLAPEAVREAAVCRLVDADTLHRVVDALRAILTELVAPYYSGVLGVDMLVDARGMLDATVELNLRTTMGYVANRFSELYLHPAAQGAFIVRRHLPGSEAAAPLVADGRLLGGTLHLTPPNPHFDLLAVVQPSS